MPRCRSRLSAVATAPLASLGVDAVLLDPARAEAYRAFLRRSAATDEAYLFTDPNVRFEPEDDDLLVCAPGVRAHAAASGGVELVHEPSGWRLGLPDASLDRAEALLRLLDGTQTLGELRETHARALAPLIEGAFGRVLFSPLAVAELERRIPSAEIVRFPGAPYEIVRSYWRNMAAVRGRLRGFFAAIARTPAAGLAGLRGLHALSLLGDGGRSFYRPASPAVRGGLLPGELWLESTRVNDSGDEAVFEAGPRVHATLLGSEHYAALLAASVDDPAALAARRIHDADDGLDWGRVLTGRAAGDLAPAPWFCPPRPMSDAHFESLFESLGRALGATEEAAALVALAEFHQKFVRLHPFRAGNQALCMNLSNAVLARRNGFGIPHLVLDHLALRLATPAYARCFARAVRAFSVNGTPAARFAALSAKKQSLFAFIGKLRAARSLPEASAIAGSDPGGATLALLRDA
jgi:hypothetical protein